jgi:carbon monoxide dehydrogenase subunit G
MRLEHSFTVPVPVASAWAVLLDLPRIAPCMPGATLTSVQDDTFTGTVKVKLGPIALTYQGKGRFVERDEAARRMVVEATGKDIRSAGTAAATVTATLAADGDRTAVEVITDLTVTGRPAQFGRGMLAEVGSKLIGQFADCLANTLGEQETAPADAPPGPPALRPEQSVSGSTAGTATAATAAAAPAVPGGAAASAGEDSVTASDPAVAPPGRVVEGKSQRIPSSAPIEAEPIDLLRLTGATATARRITRYGGGAVLLIGLAWLVLRRLRR